MQISLHFGAMAAPLSEQLQGCDIDTNDLNHFQKDADAIVRLAVRGLITDSTKTSAHRKLIKNIARSIK